MSGVQPMTQPGRYQLDPLAQRLGITLGRIGRPTDDSSDTLAVLADLLSVSLRTVKNYRAHGLTSRQADRYATHVAKVHPCMLWPTWFSQANVNADIGDLEPVEMREPNVQPSGCTSDVRS